MKSPRGQTPCGLTPWQHLHRSCPLALSYLSPLPHPLQAARDGQGAAAAELGALQAQGTARRAGGRGGLLCSDDLSQGHR